MAKKLSRLTPAFLMPKKGERTIEEYGIVYCIENTLNNHKYIGQTTRTLERRISEHFNGAEHDRNQNRAVYQAINKYGKENFISYKVDNAISQEELDIKESYWIDHYNTFLSNGYNMTAGGQTEKKNHSSEEISNKLSENWGGKEFLVYTINGKLLKTTTSQILFAIELDCCVQSVNNCLRGIKSQVKEKILIFKDEFTDEILQERIARAKKNARNKPDFIAYDIKNKIVVGTWNNIPKCSNDLGYSTRSIQKQFEGKVKKPKRYLFKYINSLTEQEKKMYLGN